VEELGGKKKYNMKRIRLTEKQYDKIISELYKSTYNSAAAKAMEEEDEELALDFLRHSNEMGIEDEPNYDFYGVGSSDLDADGIPDDMDDELSVDRFNIAQRIQSELNTMLNEGSKGENYMFFSNLKQMRRQLDIMINEFDSNMVNDVLNNGHDWADDHITEAKVNIDQVFDFFMNKLKDEDGDYKDDEEFEFPVDDDYDDTEDYYNTHDKYGNFINDYPK
jgi:hypothetical protein